MASPNIDGLPTKSLKLASNLVVSSIQFLGSMPKRCKMGGMLPSMCPRLSSRMTLPVNSTSSKYSASLNGKPAGMSLRGLPANGIRDFTCWSGWLIALDFFAFSARILMEVWADKGKSTEERYNIRQQKSKPQLEQIKIWLDKALLNTLPKGKTGEALAYTHKNWVKLTEYIKDGRLNIDNNPVENAIRPFAIGRKNWLFSDSQKGAKASAMLYSMIETAKANNVEPYQYLRVVFTKLPQAESVEAIEALFPWNIDLLKS
jgi:hypothetical protein